MPHVTKRSRAALGSRTKDPTGDAAIAHSYHRTLAEIEADSIRTDEPAIAACYKPVVPADVSSLWKRITKKGKSKKK